MDQRKLVKRTTEEFPDGRKVVTEEYEREYPYQFVPYYPNPWITYPTWDNLPYYTLTTVPGLTTPSGGCTIGDCGLGDSADNVKFTVYGNWPTE
jgi:hypothetical protein